MKIFKRKIYDRLLDWKKESNGRTALLIEGARRIGKSTIVKEFAENEYESFIFIDFNETRESIKEAFLNHRNDLDTLFMIIQNEYGVQLHRRKSLIVFDEVQAFPLARQTVKYLVADGRYDFIETGSLLSIHENIRNISLPSEEESIRMYPMDFEEFAWAMQENVMIETIRKHFEWKQPLPDPIHAKAMFLFRQYMIVGGMPQCLSAYLESDRNFAPVDKEKRRILRLYRNDMMKIEANYRTKVISIFDQIPGFLSRSERRVNYNEVEPNSSFPLYHDTFFWLSDSMVVNDCFNCADPNVGLSLNEDRTYVKCYMGDTGLLISHAFNENEISDNELYRELLFGKLSTDEGMFFENVVAQLLTASGHKLFFYTHYNREKKRNDIEIDFLLTNNSKLKYKMYPVEVKSTDRYSITSLTRFQAKFHERIGGAYVIHPKNLKHEGETLYLPVYMTGYL